MRISSPEVVELERDSPSSPLHFTDGTLGLGERDYLRTSDPTREAAATFGSDAQRSLSRVIEEALDLILGVDGEGDPPGLHERLSPRLESLLGDAADAVQLVEELARRPELLPASGEIPSRELEGLGDLASILRAEIARLQRGLSRETGQVSEGDLREFAERTCTELATYFCCLELEVSSIYGLERRAPACELLRRSLIARTTVTKFRRAVLRDGGASSIEGIRSAGNALARLIGRDSFSYLFVGDRKLARELHTRILGYLRQAAPDDAPTLLQDVQAFAVLLYDINERAELLGHDAVLLDRAIASMAGLDPHQPPPSTEVQLLHRLFGRDDILDRLLISGADVAQVLARVIVVKRQLTSRGLQERAPDSAFLPSPSNGALASPDG